MEVMHSTRVGLLLDHFMKSIGIGLLLICLHQKTTAQEALSIGDTINDFTAQNSSGKKITLSEELKKGPVVIVFYRGHWCPFCERHLSVLQDSLKSITDKGASVLVITPDKPQYIEEMKKKSGATMEILWDQDYSIMKAFKVNFDSKHTSILYHGLSPQKSTPQLPVPATYIINQDFTIKWGHFDPVYRHRSKVKEILDHL